MDDKIRITYSARGEFGGRFETSPMVRNSAEYRAVMKSLRADPNVYNIQIVEA